jgi:hypothetical protein
MLVTGPKYAPACGRRKITRVLRRRIGNETEKRVRKEYEERGRREEVVIRQDREAILDKVFL